MGRKVAVGLDVLVAGGTVATMGLGVEVLVAVGASVAVGVSVGVAVIVAVSLAWGVGVEVAVGGLAAAVRSATARVCSTARVAFCASIVSKPFANTVATAGSGEAVAVGLCTVGAPQAARLNRNARQIKRRKSLLIAASVSLIRLICWHFVKIVNNKSRRNGDRIPLYSGIRN